MFTRWHSTGTEVFLVLSFNLEIPRYKFTILRLFNILPYIFLYFKHKQTHYLCGPLVVTILSQTNPSTSGFPTVFLDQRWWNLRLFWLDKSRRVFYGKNIFKVYFTVNNLLLQKVVYLIRPVFCSCALRT